MMSHCHRESECWREQFSFKPGFKSA